MAATENTRGGVRAGQQVLLRAVFTDAQGALVDPDSTPVLYIYDESVGTTDVVAEAEAGSYSSALSGPFTATKLSTGFYQYTYAVPANAAAGSWHDVWVAQMSGNESWEVLDFEVIVELSISSQRLSTNTMLVVKLTDAIQSSDGSLTLEDTTLYYSTTYSPLYSAPDLVRTKVGRWIDFIPDDTLALMIHLSSLEAQFIQGPSERSHGDLALARREFTTFDAAYRALMIPAAGQQAGYTSGGQKTLGDLSIKQGTVNVEVPDRILEWLFDQREEWWRVVNAGGNIVPGQGLGPTYAVKGVRDPDRRMIGRLWENPRDVAYAQPTVNTKRRRGSRRRGQMGFDGWRDR